MHENVSLLLICSLMRPLSSTRSSISLELLITLVRYLSYASGHRRPPQHYPVTPLSPRYFCAFVVTPSVVNDVMSFCISLSWPKFLVVSIFAVWRLWNLLSTSVYFFGVAGNNSTFRRKYSSNEYVVHPLPLAFRVERLFLQAHLWLIFVAVWLS